MMNLPAIDNTTKPLTIEDIKELIGGVLKMAKDEMPDNKKAVVELGFMVLPVVKFEIQNK
jgi:hypothetical protein